MFTVLHSSAGAGKTHALVKHYLGHCLGPEDPAAYRGVLALTFTNKAAGEMKERVLLYMEDLAAARFEDARIADLAAHLEEHHGLDRDTMARRAEDRLGHILHHWGDVAIGTIDAFTRRVVRPFARDLRLDHELRMTTEESWYRDLAVDALMEAAGTDPAITALLSEACLQLLHEERAWDPERPLRDLSGELTKERAIKPLLLLRELDPATVAPLAARLRGEWSAFRQRVRVLGDGALRMIGAAGVAAEDMAHGRNGIHGWFRKLADFDGAWDAPGPNARKPMETGKWHGGRADAATIAALEDISGGLARIFREAEELRERELPRQLLRRAIGRELPTAFALHELDLRLEEVKRADAVAFFSDLTRRVAEVTRGEPVPFIHERMGERYRHFLIDEFQDTSLMQWTALLPLIDNALGSGGSALLVGDAKQAIYRWRNGEVRLFTELPRVFGREDDPVEAERERTLQRWFRKGEPLDANHRSSAVVVGFNNRLFGELGQLLPEGLRSVYDGHEQRAVREGAGLVRLEKLDKSTRGEERTRAFLDFVSRCVHEAMDDGFAPGDIAVLTRARKLGREVAGHLIAQGFAVVSPDGLQLSGDPVIELLIDLLRFLHADDPAAAARVLQYQAMLQAPPKAAMVDPFAGTEDLPKPAAMLRAWLRAHAPHGGRLRTTLTALIGGLARAHGIKPAEDAQVLTLLDEAHAWTTEHGQDIGGFLAHWERTGGQRATEPPEHGRAVRVMTVHKAKGLQFPVVIVPDAEMAGRGNFGERFWVDPGEAVPELPVALVRESGALRSIGLPEIEEEKDMRLLDELNLLYVAFTRPEQRLYAMVHEATVSAAGKGLLAFMEQNGGEGGLTEGERAAPWSAREAVEPSTLADPAGAGADGGMAVPTLRFEAPEEWDPADPDPYRAFGNAVHEVLARVRTAADVEGAIADAVERCLLDADAATELSKRLKELLASPALAPWFGEGLEVRTEATIITADGKALRPDRFVIDAGKARVLDIKTGRPDERHHEQVRAYVRLLGELGHAGVEGALLYLRDGTVQAVEA